MASDPKDAPVRLGCGGFLGAFVGLVCFVGFANSAWSLPFWPLFVGAIVTFAVLGYIYGDRLFHSVHKWIGWFR